MSRVIIFDVEHGFCAFVKSPTGETLMIDCGRKESFSPVVYVIDNELRGARLTQLIVTHPHDDHIEDIESVTSKLPPRILYRQRYNWETYNAPAPAVNWGMDIKAFYLRPAQAQALNQAKWVNNSGMVVVVAITGTRFTEKFVFGADVETDGFIELLKNPAFRQAVAGAHFYVASHHGHCSGFSPELFVAMGRPFLNLISVRSGDDEVDPRYSSPEYARGADLNGERRYSLTTRTDGSIFIDVDDEGRFYLHVHDLDDNEDAMLAAVRAFLARR